MPYLTYRQIDRLAGPTRGGKLRSHAYGIIKRGKGMTEATARAYAKALGARPEWLLMGIGAPPSASHVEATVERGLAGLTTTVIHNGTLAPNRSGGKSELVTGEEDAAVVRG